MSFRRELGVIPTAAWIVGWVIYVCFTVPMFLVVVPNDPEIGKWPRWGQALFVYGIFLLVVALVVLSGYVYGDAKRRGMRYVMWTLLAIFVPDFIGIILYFILRDPLPAECASCHRLVLSRFAFCPHCGSAMHPVCPQCGKTLEPNWSNCAYCGAKVLEQSHAHAASQR